MAAPFGAGFGRSICGSDLRIARQPALDRFENAFAPFRPLEALGQRAQRRQPLRRGRRLHGDVADGVVLEHARARHVAGLRFALAPGRDLDQDGKLLGLAHPGLEPHPGPLRIGAVGVGRGEDLHLVVHPVGAAAPSEIGDQRRIDVAQVRDVGHRVGDLGRRQRPARPVGEAVRLVERVAGDALHELVVGDRIAVAQHHGGDLGVENRMRDDVGAVPDDFDVLARGVEHLEHASRSPSARRTA